MSTKRMLPPARPGRPRPWAENIVRRAGVIQSVWILGCRGYYLDSMGVAGANDLGIYDDAVFVGGPTGFRSFNANTDPARRGWNASVGKPMAMLQTGVWLYRIGRHRNQYTALIQAQAVTVLRDTWEETGWFGINIHRGSRNSVSSEGCQTIWPDQWAEFIAFVQAQMRAADRRTIHYVLEEVQG
jgi:lysozyme